jgi:putative membrane protein
MMTESFRSNPGSVLIWQWRNALYYAIAGAAAWALIVPAGLKELQLPVTPISVVGAAIGIFASFRANQAYDRWWEGRRLWGGLVNASRHWASQVLAYLPADEAPLAEALVLRQVTFVHALRCRLRGQTPWEDPDFRRAGEDTPALRGSTNLTAALLLAQLRALAALSDRGGLDPHRLASLDRTLTELIGLQGGCERIQGTPLPRGVGFILVLLINTFAIFLPFALVHDLGWVAVPVNVVVCLAFALISEAGRVLEDPFNLFYNGLPLHDLSIKIERNLREALGHTELPAPVAVQPPGVLM